MPFFDRLFGRGEPTQGDELNSPEIAHPLNTLDGVGMTQGGGGFAPAREVITKADIERATQTLLKYKESKANLQDRVIDNEEWYRVRHWRTMQDRQTTDVQPTSAWLFNCLASKHADTMDNYPSPNILPREEGDKGEAEMLSSIVPVILEQNGFEDTYSDEQYAKLKSGTGIYGVFWDKTKLNGLGDISIRKVDLLNLFWESGISDIQKSRNLFHCELADNETLVEQYPELQGKLGTATIDLAHYFYDDSVDTTDKSVVVDWYYHKYENGRTTLHYVKYVNDTVLYATENDQNGAAEYGLYNHGLYPFVFDTLFPIEDTPCGFGYIDIGRDTQAYIDRLDQALIENALANASPRYFIRDDGSVNEQEFADCKNKFIHVKGNIDDNSLKAVEATGLPAIYVTMLQDKVQELKETTGNRDVSNGGSASGVTAASAIAAMQEAGSKLSRDTNKGSYRAFRDVVLIVIELIRQFYDLPRMFRIMGQEGTERYISYTNAGIQPQAQGMDFGEDMGLRLPLFDVEVVAQKASPYSKMAQNELALQFYQQGFFNPQMADQALACLSMMDFDRKSFVTNKIAENGGMFMQMQQMQAQMVALAQMIDRDHGTNLAEQIMSGGAVPVVDGNFGAQAGGGEAPAEATEGNETLGGDSKKAQEASNTKKARQTVADATAPR